MVTVAIYQLAVLNDIHFPFEHKAYYEALKIMKDWPDLRGIYLNGDIAEIESVSRHPKSETAQSRLLEEIKYTNAKFDQLQKMFPEIPVHYLAGNHEARVYKFIRDCAPQMWGMLELPKILRLDEREGWRFYDYSPMQLVKLQGAKNLYCRHEPIGSGMFPARGTAEKSIHSIIFGHTHIYQQFVHKKFAETPFSVTAVSNGFLGDLKYDIFDYRGTRDNWQLGFMRVDVDSESGDWELRFQFL